MSPIILLTITGTLFIIMAFIIGWLSGSNYTKEEIRKRVRARKLKQGLEDNTGVLNSKDNHNNYFKQCV